MRSLSQFLLLFVLLLLVACQQKDMKIDPYLEAHSYQFKVNIDAEQADELITFGHFSSYNKDFGLAWMEETGISDFFKDGKMLTFSTDNNDNYTYDNVIIETDSPEKMKNYIEKFEFPSEGIDQFTKAYLGYFYAPHDEYSMIYVKQSENEIIGYLSNGFDLYEIHPVIEESNKKIQGYQFKLNKEFVGSLQSKGNRNFRMTNEYCDATEIVLASIASMIIKTEKL